MSKNDLASGNANVFAISRALSSSRRSLRSTYGRLACQERTLCAIHYLYIRARGDGVAVYSITMPTISHAAFRPATSPWSSRSPRASCPCRPSPASAPSLQIIFLFSSFFCFLLFIMLSSSSSFGSPVGEKFSKIYLKILQIILFNFVFNFVQFLPREGHSLYLVH